MLKGTIFAAALCLFAGTTTLTACGNDDETKVTSNPPPPPPPPPPAKSAPVGKVCSSDADCAPDGVCLSSQGATQGFCSIACEGGEAGAEFCAANMVEGLDGTPACNIQVQNLGLACGVMCGTVKQVSSGQTEELGQCGPGWKCSVGGFSSQDPDFDVSAVGICEGA